MRIDEFVFLDATNLPLYVRKWGEDLWLFRWKKAGGWVSIRRLNEGESNSFPRNLTQQQQNAYRREADLANPHTWLSISI